MKWIGFFAFLAALLFLALSVFNYSCSIDKIFTGIDKGSKSYILVTDNKDLLFKVIEDMQEVQKAYRTYEEDRTLFTEKALKDELDDLYNSSLKLREFLKDLDKIIKPQQ